MSTPPPKVPPKTTNAALAEEVRKLTAEVAKLSGELRPTRIRHGWVGVIAKDLGTNPRTQYRVHLYGVVYWLLNFPVIIYIFFAHRMLWNEIGIFITLIYSIYANLATDYGAMSSALAAQGREEPPEIPLSD